MRSIKFLLFLFILLPFAVYSSVPDPDIFDGSKDMKQTNDNNSSSGTSAQGQASNPETSSKSKEKKLNKDLSTTKNAEIGEGSGVISSEDFKNPELLPGGKSGGDNSKLNEKFKITKNSEIYDPAANKIFIPPGYPIQKTEGQREESSLQSGKQSIPTNQARGQGSWGNKTSPGVIITGPESGNSVPAGL